MDDFFSFVEQQAEQAQKNRQQTADDGALPAANVLPVPDSRQNVLTVSELSFKLRRVVEGTFGRVAVEGEISGLKTPASGHLYFNLKDADNVLNAVVWRSAAERLKVLPEDGMQVVAYGTLTTYGARSSYQLTVDKLEPAGLGALMALLEKRKQKLAGEGLFDEAAKKPLPFLPRVVGVVTSPTGAVIQDMLHRLQARCPRPVLLWPVAVQGEGAAEQIAAAIRGFNTLPASIPTPDVLIVARGGGSLEDLWAFNEEVVVRAVAASHIPVISGVGHEPDVTLVDYAADKRAPTPTAAAEMAVPVRADVLATLSFQQNRLHRQMLAVVRQQQAAVAVLQKSLPHPLQAVHAMQHRLAERVAQAHLAVRQLLRQRHMQVVPAQRLQTAVQRFVDNQKKAVPAPVWLQKQLVRHVHLQQEQLQTYHKLLHSYAPNGPLKRGYSYVTDAEGRVVRSAAVAAAASRVRVHFADGTADMTPLEPISKLS